MNKIPASVCILTHNSARTIERALRAVQDFDEVVLVDGGSTDKTIEIALRYGAKVIAQDAAFLNEKRGIRNFAGVRNQYIAAATHDWIFALDSDECPTPELVNEIRTVISEGKVGAYWVPRLYVRDGRDITCNPGPTSKQVRFFHKDAVSGYIKEVHERIVPKPGVYVGTLQFPMRIPLEIDPKAVRAKWRRYIHLEMQRRSSISLRKWIQFSFKECARMILYSYRVAKVLLFCRGTRAPVSFLLLRLWYHWMLIIGMLKIIRRF